jgi:NADH-quinone oxidoreductase subunit J
MELKGTPAVLYLLLAFFTLIMGLSLIRARSAVHAALYLMGTLIGVAGLFLLLHAEFVAGAQILVYVGGVVVLFIFVIMLVNVREEITDVGRLFTRQETAAWILVGLMAVSTIIAIRWEPNPLPRSEAQAQAEEQAEAPTAVVSADTQRVGETLYTKAALPFEIASVLLLVAIIGSVVLARTRRQEETFD